MKSKIQKDNWGEFMMLKSGAMICLEIEGGKE